MLDINVKRPRLTEQLPPTPCTEDMNTKMRDIATGEGVSIAEVQRAAYSLFLDVYYSKAIEVRSMAIAALKPEG
jgi:hypothetical protein